MKGRFFICLAFFLFGALALPASGVEVPVSLIVEAHKERVLSPGFAFELRFGQAMIPEDEVGLTDAVPPLAIQPPMAGRWRWISTLSGVFEPTEVPPMATRYQLSLQPGLKTAAGALLESRILETYSTPSFALKGSSFQNYFPTEDAAAVPRVLLLFNASVDPRTLAPSVKFISATGKTVDARLRRPGKNDAPFPAYKSIDRNVLTWEVRVRDFLAGRPPKDLPNAEDAPDSEEDSEQSDRASERPVPDNQILVTPVQALAPGQTWTLLVGEGAPAQSDPARLSKTVRIEIGKVQPFELREVRAENLPLSGKTVVVTFSKLLSRVARADPSKFVRVTPDPGGVKVSWKEDAFSENGSIVVAGNFALGREYTVTVAGEISAEETFTLGEALQRTVRFSPAPARLYFEGFAEWQQRSGTRRFGLMSVNASEIAVTAKRLPVEHLVAAFNAYRGYRADEPKEDEPYQRVDLSSVPGPVLWKQNFKPGVPVDSRGFIRLSWDDILGKGGTGAVFLSAEQLVENGGPEPKKAGAQALVQVTDLGAIWKVGAETFLHVFSLATAQPIPGALVTLLDPAGSPLLQVRTGSDGTVSIPNQAALGKMKWLLLSKADDQLLLHFEAMRGESEFQTFRINDFGAERDLYWGGYPDRERGEAFLFTDRPVYRPGEVIHFKGLLRNPDPRHPLPSPGGKGLLKAVDTTGRTVVQRTVVLSETGAFDGDLALPKSRVGDFSLFFQMGEPAVTTAGAACSVTVQEYVPNAFELKIGSPSAARLDSPQEFAVSAKYLRGGSLQKARVAWSLRAVDTRFEPEGFAGFAFANALYDYRLEGRLLGKPMHAVSGSAALGAPGDVRIPVNLPSNPTLPQPRSVRVFAEVTDLNQQTVSERAQFTAHARDFYLGVAEFPSVLSAGDRLPLQVVAVAASGLPVEESVEVVAKLSRLEWQTNRVQDADAAENFRSELLTEPLGETRLRTSPVVRTPIKWQLAEPDKKDTSFTLEKPGLYLLTLSAKDRAGREVVTLATAHVQAKGKIPLTWDYRNNFQAELVPDKARYEPGETATLLVKTPISGPALVSVEGAGVQRHFLTRLEGNAPAIRVPLEETDAPNVHVCVTVLRGALDSPRKLPVPEYRIGYAMLHVARPGTELVVALTPSRAEYRPGEQAEVFCEVRDAAGRPVSGAEVTLWAADEGVLSFTGFETPDPAGVFQRTRPLRVRTGLTISKLLRESDDQLPESLFENKGYLVGGFGKGGEDGVRRRFLGTAFWAPALRTDANGKANVAFTVPDGLTRYRIMGVVHHGGHRFGKAQASFEINKPIMLDAAAPLFAHVGDRLVLRGVVQNTTAAAGRATVRVELDGKARASQTSVNVEVAAQKSTSVDLPLEMLQSGDAGWTLSAEFTSADGRVFRDAVLLKCRIDSPVPALREVVHKRLVAAETNLLDLVDPVLLRGTGSVRVSLAHSRIHELRGSVEHLLHYPYGCAEQTVSALLPWLALRDFREAFPDLRLGAEEFQVAVERGITRVFSMQTPSGGLAYWPGGHTPNLWGSAYAAVGLALAGKSGVAVDEEKFGRLLNFLSKTLRGAADSSEKQALSPRALACYALALAGKPEAAYHELLFQKRDLLSVESRAFLALAALETPNGEAVARTLLALPSEQLEEDFWFGSVSRAKGVLLLAWARLAPGSATTERLANELLEERSSGHWRTTQGNAWALLGLTSSIRHAETGFVDSAGALVMGAESVPFRLATKHAVFEREVPLENPATLVLHNPGGRPLYCQLAVETRPEAQPEPRQDRGYSLTRSYQRLNEDDSLSPLGEARVGERVLVTLELRARDRASYVALEDPLPAVFEAVNPRFKSQGLAASDRVRTFSADFTEVRADRVFFFADSLGPGRHLFRYVARVRAVGSATAPAPKVEEMYRPDRFGLGSPTVVRSVEAP